MSLLRFPGIPDYNDAVRELTPVLPLLGDAISHGWRIWRQLEVDNPDIRHGLSETTRAGFVNDKIVARARHLFADYPRVRVIEKSANNPIFLLKMGEKYLVRFKKLDSLSLPSNIPTDNQRSIARQELLEGFEEQCYLTAGYRLNRYQTSILDMVVSYIYVNTIFWSIPLPEPGISGTILAPTTVGGPTPPRVRPRLLEIEGEA